MKQLETIINVNEKFGPTLQGEGQLLGTPCLFIRTVGCNLRCEWSNPDGTTTKCDSMYTSWYPEKAKQESVEDLLKWVNVNASSKYIVISGGEPFLQKGIVDLINTLHDNNYHVTVETNGTIFRESKADLISMSPKLKNTAPKEDIKAKQLHIKNRIYDKSLPEFKNFYNNIQYKFVVNDAVNLLDIKNNFISKYGLDKNDIWLMPQGITQKQLREKSQMLFDICSKEGYNFSPRMHIDVYGDKRGI